MIADKIARDSPLSSSGDLHNLPSEKGENFSLGGEIASVQIIDQSKEISADFRHRALRHHAEGIFMAETIFGQTLTLSTGRIIPTRWVGEQHVKEDLGFIPSFADWVKAIRPEPWMGRSERIEALVDPHLASPVVEVS
ncbi:MULTISPECIES: hypothetical protein [unclassified Roseovarius]|uniref:DUF6915 family protein n=1 Tax=Roseovarius sp. EC-HK134 TaxID=2038394 RepID=UPI0020C74A57|nr:MULTISPECIES: hypothetical protein [unclassified Roseovarius]